MIDLTALVTGERWVPRRFRLVRHEDETGTSGIGVVVEGVQFTDGTVVLRWLTNTTSIAIYASIDDVIAIHGHGGKTVVVWLDEEPQVISNVERYRGVLDAFRRALGTQHRKGDE